LEEGHNSIEDVSSALKVLCEALCGPFGGLLIILLQPDAEAKSLMNIKTGAGRGRDFVVIIVATVSFQIVVEESAPKRFCIPIPLSSSSWLIPKSLDNRKTFVTLSVWSKGVSALL